MDVVTIQNNEKVHVFPVTIGQDMGTEVEILGGIQAADAGVASPVTFCMKVKTCSSLRRQRDHRWPEEPAVFVTQNVTRL
jgi:hypothetical protein